ncbi:MAG: O-Methyltransferase involved in polyketide biosynthesis [Myxococcales bacterium]|nr:O-Methyltransferase involved in polyketide biosynthesis [Myxococcales bacterium]
MDADSSASKTALMVCAYRARASRWDKPLFIDPWAEALAGSDGHDIAKRLDARFPPMEMWLALRVAYLDHLVDLAVDRLSIRQVVILGAGYDTRAARLPRAGVRFFEVDHPATQASKRERLAKLDGYPVDAARYVSCNFEREDPIDRLAANHFDLREPALVIWEGVVPYLTEAAVRATASRLATGLDPRSLVAFDFVGKRLAEGHSLSDKDKQTRDYVGELGEPIRYGTDDVLPLLVDCGFRWVRSLDFNELALEMLGDYKRDRQFRFQHLALAAARTPVAGWP